MSDTEKKVKKLYEDYPYPKYHEEWDARHPIPLRWNPNEALSAVNHYCFRGRKRFDDFRVLIAGCGIGDDLIWLAKQLELYENTKVVGIDLSSRSLEISSKRADLYNLANVELHQMSLLDLTTESFGSFDFILCGGVLHHLEDPSAGLICLRDVMNETGAMLIMVYGRIGRTHIYQMQDLLRLVNRDVENIQQKINNFKIIYNHLPENNLFRKNENIIQDHKASDNGIVDMLLHPQDRAYTIPELFEWIEECGLRFIEFGIDERVKYKYTIPNIDYSGIGPVEQYAINELLFGDIYKHIFYTARSSERVASPDTPENIPVWVGLDHNQRRQLFEYLENSPDLNARLSSEKRELMVPLREKDVKMNYRRKMDISLHLDPDTFEVIKNIDNRRTLEQILDKAISRRKINLTPEQLLEKSKPVLNMLIDEMIILLKHPQSDLKLA